MKIFSDLQQQQQQQQKTENETNVFLKDWNRKC